MTRAATSCAATRWAAVALLPVLAACQPMPRASDAGPATYRDSTALIASKADFDAQRFTGDWHEVARFPGSRGCAAGRLRFDPAGATGLLRTTTCPDGSVQRAAVEVAPFGRLTIRDEGESASVWVLWTDASYRTAILVSPDGTGGRILDRAPALPGDRRLAAMEVLEFNGFDSARLQTP